MPVRNLGNASGNFSNQILRERRDIPFDDTILMLEPSANPLQVLTARINKRPVTEKEFYWWEEEPDSRHFNLTTGPDDEATTINLGSGNGIFVRAGDVLKAVAKDGTTLLEEQMLVTDVSGDTVTVARGWGENSAADFSGGSVMLMQMGNASAEGAADSPRRSSEVARVYNYTGIIRTSLTLSKTADASQQEANPQERRREQRHQGIEHAIQIEKRLWFGERYQDSTTSDEGVIQMPRGVLEFIQTHRDFAAPNPDFMALVEWTEKLFQYGSDSRWCFAGPGFLTWLAGLYDSKLQFRSGDDTYGIPVFDVETPHGRLRMIRTRLFKGDVLSNMAVALDITEDKKLVSYRPVRGRDTTLRLNVQPPKADYVEDEFLTEAGIQVAQEKRHGVFFLP